MNRVETRACLVLVLGILASGCSAGIQATPGTVGVLELLQDPIFGVQVHVYGQVSQLGELRCPCFALVSDGETLFVWYDLMFEENENQRPSVSVEGVRNGDWVVVGGELRESDGSSGTFWASGIEVIR